MSSGWSVLAIRRWYDVRVESSFAAPQVMWSETKSSITAEPSIVPTWLSCPRPPSRRRIHRFRAARDG